MALEQFNYLLTHWWCQQPGCNDCIMLGCLMDLLARRFLE